MLKHEIKRAFCSREWSIALAIGIIISVVQYFAKVIPVIGLLDLGPSKGMIPHSVFSKWLGADGSTVASSLFFMILPILAVLPHGGSYYRDLKNGYIRQMVLSKGKASYILCKYIAAFISGGLVIIIPMILNLIMTACVLPSIKPVLTVGYFAWISPKRFMPMLPYINPYLYFGIYMIIIFCFAGVLNGISLMVSPFARNTFTVWITPFIFVGCIGSIANSLGYGYYNLADFLNPVQMEPGVSWKTLIISFLVITVPSVMEYCIHGFKSDIY